jgi:DNA-binding MarR family transcriptional regulator
MAIKSKSAPKAIRQRNGPGETIDLGWLQGLIGFNLRIAYDASARAYLKSVASTAPHFAMLALIHLNPGLTQVALSRAVSRDSSSLTAILDDLCGRKLVTRTRPEHDRRSYELRITAAGVKALEKLKLKVDAHEQELNRLFTRDEKASLVDMLRTIATGLSDEPADAKPGGAPPGRLSSASPPSRRDGVRARLLRDI